MARLLVAMLALTLATTAAAQSTQPVGAKLIKRSAAVQSGAVVEEAPRVGSSPISPGLPRVLLSLAAVLGLVVLLYWVGRRMGPRGLGASRAIQVLAATRISSKQRLLIVQVGRRLLVLADSGQNLSTLCEIDNPNEAAALLGQIHGNGTGGEGRSFSAVLGAAKDQMRAGHDPGNDAGEDLDATRHELSGLMQRVRVMTRQIDRA